MQHKTEAKKVRKHLSENNVHKRMLTKNSEQ